MTEAGNCIGAHRLSLMRLNHKPSLKSQSCVTGARTFVSVPPFQCCLLHGAEATETDDPRSTVRSFVRSGMDFLFEGARAAHGFRGRRRKDAWRDGPCPLGRTQSHRPQPRSVISLWLAAAVHFRAWESANCNPCLTGMATKTVLLVLRSG